jgi:hypothetical protein
MPLIVVQNGEYCLTRLAWMSEEALAVQESAVESLVSRSKLLKFKDAYDIK